MHWLRINHRAWRGIRQDFSVGLSPFTCPVLLLDFLTIMEPQTELEQQTIMSKLTHQGLGYADYDASDCSRLRCLPWRVVAFSFEDLVATPPVTGPASIKQDLQEQFTVVR
jgi:hypothetical protein